MGTSELSRVKSRSNSRKKLNEIYDDSIKAYLIHYSCESFYAETGQPGLVNSTRVTSIAIRNLKSGQTKSWSIHKSAELKGKLAELMRLIQANAPLENPAAQDQRNEAINEVAAFLDNLERDMLDGYFAFLKENFESMYIHWNMRDDNYGFYALEHRYRVLGGSPISLHDNKKFDLARELIVLYGIKYAPHNSASGRKGRLMSLIELNKISDLGALQGSDEAQAFVKGEFIKLHQSTLRKVDILANIFDRCHDKSIKTKASFMDKYGIHPVAIIEVVKNHPLVTSFIFLAVIGSALLKYWQIIAAFF
jgi:hypothetical protein